MPMIRGDRGIKIVIEGKEYVADSISVNSDLRDRPIYTIPENKLAFMESVEVPVYIDVLATQTVAEFDAWLLQ